ncbi:hypothetical protein B0T19DRAFT_396425 [Cercophora scortea]|uniref:Uncharacterized protein n=1 Tax=Cercophora scortea TaxID=314031 RepID=A0AAE0MLB6_9PEZI|nr:hypothetical protein B0T19DRAFT_396425 [Cercophora scortea]
MAPRQQHQQQPRGSRSREPLRPSDELTGEQILYPHNAKGTRNSSFSASSNGRHWQEEYFCALLCLATATSLGVLLHHYDEQVVPELGWGVQIDTAIIALVTVVRVSMKAFVETAVSQGAWVWVSEAAQRRDGHEARLKDFKVFDEASRGLWGSLCLLWRLRLRHLGCVGAAVIILAHGFETFSQQMVTFEQRPRRVVNATMSPAPPPSRSEVWDTYLSRGYTGDLVPALSTKAAVYSGIISTELPAIMASCETANCSWPIIPTLAACGECTSVPVTTRCNQTARTCTYSTTSGTFIDDPIDAADHSSFRVSPSNGTVHPIDAPNRAYFSVFDMLALAQPPDQNATVTANECALWFCIQSYIISVSEGVQNQTTAANWSTVALQHGSGLRGSEYVFVDIPTQLNVNNGTRYSVTYEAMSALRSFMAAVTSGTVYADFNTIDYSSDWVEAMWNATTDNLQDWITTFALSLTVKIRQNGKITPGSEGRYNGAAVQLAPFIKVQWRWMVYPGVMMGG